MPLLEIFTAQHSNQTKMRSGASYVLLVDQFSTLTSPDINTRNHLHKNRFICIVTRTAAASPTFTGSIKDFIEKKKTLAPSVMGSREHV